MTKPTFVIVGASLTGAKAAEELRTRGFDGRILLIGAEQERPYERPPLTKDYLRGESEREQAHVHPADFYAQQEIELVTGMTVTSSPRWRAEAANSLPIQPAPTTTTRPPVSSRARSRSQSASVRR